MLNVCGVEKAWGRHDKEGLPCAATAVLVEAVRTCPRNRGPWPCGTKDVAVQRKEQVRFLEYKRARKSKLRLDDYDDYDLS